MEGFKKEPSVQDLLKQQVQEQEFGGGDGGDIPRGDGDGDGDSEDEGFAGIWDEVVQVFLATVAFIFVVSGEYTASLEFEWIDCFYLQNQFNALIVLLITCKCFFFFSSNYFYFYFDFQ